MIFNIKYIVVVYTMGGFFKTRLFTSFVKKLHLHHNNVKFLAKINALIDLDLSLQTVKQIISQSRMF